MKVLALDISTHCGWAEVIGDEANPILRLEGVGLIEARPKESLTDMLDCYGYPWGYYRFVGHLGLQICRLVKERNPDVVVIEEINLGKSRYSQRILEWLHFCVMHGFWMMNINNVIYISSSQWRSCLGLVMSKQDKKNNAKLSKANRLASETGQKVDKKALGVRGKINKKHLAVRWVNEQFGANYKVKDNDICDAICLAAAYLRNAEPCDGRL